MLLRFDEYPYHQITASFAGVAGSDPQWNDGHYVCLSDQAGQVGLTSSLRLYHNNDVLDGFVMVGCRACDGGPLIWPRIWARRSAASFRIVLIAS